MMKRLLLFIAMGVMSWSMSAQTSLEGKVTELESGEPVIFGYVELFKNDVGITGTETDLDGNYSFSNIDPGTYDVEFSYVGFQTQRVEDVLVSAGKANRLDAEMSAGVNLEEVVVVDYEVPLVEQDKTTTGGTITSENIKQMPIKDITALAATTAGVSSQDGGAINIGGARSEATVYYIDGMRVTGRMVPQTEVEQMQVLTGGIPAQYGDLAGGAISVTTKGPSAKYSGGIELETSEFLDPYGYNLFYGNVSGPIIKSAEGKSILGFRLAAQYRLREEDDPPALGVFRASEASIKDLENQPLTTIDGLTIATGEFYRGEENGGPVRELSARPNEDEEQLDVTAKFDLRLSESIDVQLTGTYFDGADRFTPSNQWAVFNYQRNPYSYDNRYRGIMRFRHRLGRQAYGGSQSDDEKKAKSASLIKNAVYTIEAGYQYSSNRVEDLIHEDRLFDYGYIGKFNVDYFDRPGLVGSETPGAVQVTIFTPTGPVDTFFAHSNFGSALNQENPYEPNMEINPILNNYNKDLVGDRRPDNVGAYNTYNGFVSGVFDNIWTLYDNVGTVYNRFSKDENEIYTLQANSSFDFLPGGSDKGRHNVQFGILYEQRVDRNWRVSPRGLWTVARTLVNNHITGVNYDAPTGDTFFEDVNGDGVDEEFEIFEYSFEDSPEGTSPFWKSLRNELGIPLYQPYNIDRVDPSKLRLDMFTSRELTDQNAVGYHGYDYLGNRVSSDVTFDDFFTDRDEFGNRTYLVAPYRPIYFAGYIQDKFTFKDIIFRLGVRVERFDANTKVLKDQRSLYEIQTAEEYYAGNPQDRPQAVGDDFLVYIEEPNSPSVKGYRVGNTWYDANGTQLNDGTQLFQGGVVTPAYVKESPNIKSNDFEVSNSFEDYTPQWNILPRLAFSFPISDEANFFAHYDILAQRPNAAQGYVSPLQYYYFEDAGRTPLDNPNLRPVKTINYEVGFRQKISNSSAITISAFYREMRDLIQRQTILFVPGNVGQYDTYGNLDFGTVKEFKFQYDLRRTGNIQVRAFYRLQFADGTGSNADSQRGLTDRGNLRTLFPLSYDERHRFVANIDYRYSSGKKYTGPRWFGSDVFANAGLNLQASAVSGRPFTPALAPGKFSGLRFDGGFNSARKPWTFAVDARLDKNFTIARGENNRPINLNVYLRSENLFNARNVVNVYTFTGSPTNDGYLGFNTGEADIQQYRTQREGIAANEQVFIEAYNWRLLNPDFFVQPRRLFLGAIVEF